MGRKLIQRRITIQSYLFGYNLPTPPPSLFSPYLRSLLLAGNRAYSPIRRTLYTRVCSDLVLVVSDCCLCDWADVAGVRLEHVWVVGRKDCSCCAYDRAESIVHLLGLGRLYVLLERRARCSLGALGGDGRVCGEVVVVVAGCAYDWALWVVC